MTSEVFFIIYFVLSIGVTRMRAELGSPVHDLHRAGAHYMMVDTLGSRAFTPGDLTIFSFYQFFIFIKLIKFKSFHLMSMHLLMQKHFLLF